MTALKQQRNSQFSKTKMCRFELLGMCAKGPQCPFAHGSGELRPLPDLRCTKLCKELLQSGECSTKNCSYAHSKEELRGMTDKPTAPQRARRGRGRAAEASAPPLSGAVRPSSGSSAAGQVPFDVDQCALGPMAGAALGPHDWLGSSVPYLNAGMMGAAADAAAWMAQSQTPTPSKTTSTLLHPDHSPAYVPLRLESTPSRSGATSPTGTVGDSLVAAANTAIAAPPTSSAAVGGVSCGESVAESDEQEWEEMCVGAATPGSMGTEGFDASMYTDVWGGYAPWSSWSWGGWDGLSSCASVGGFGQTLPSGSVHIDQQVTSVLRASTASSKVPHFPIRPVRTSASTLCTLGDEAA